MKSRQQYLKNSYPAIVRLGVKRLNCRRQGICEVKMVTSFDEDAFPLKENRAAAYIKVSNQTVEIRFLTDSMNRLTIKKHFSNKVFLVEDDFYFFCREVSNRVLKIAKGKYSIRRDGSQLVLSNRQLPVYQEA